MAKKAYVYDGSAWVEITSQPTVPTATTGNAGITQLTDSISSTSTSTAATPNSVKTAYDQAITATTTADSKAEVATTTPAAIGSTASVGTGTTAARADHVHPGVPTTRTITGTAPITVGGVSGTGQDLSADLTVAATAATVSAAGVVQLTDSSNSTSTTTAATPNAVLQSTKNIQASLYNGATRVGNLPNWFLTLTMNQTSGTIVFTRHVPERNFTVSNISFINGDTASAGLTLCRFGIYTRSGTTMTLVARTASDTTIFNTTHTRNTRALNTTGGFPATYDFVAGSEYWVAVIQVGTTVANLLSGAGAGLNYANSIGSFGYTRTAQTDLGTSVTSVTVLQNRVYSEVS